MISACSPERTKLICENKRSNKPVIYTINDGLVSDIELNRKRGYVTITTYSRRNPNIYKVLTKSLDNCDVVEVYIK